MEFNYVCKIYRYKRSELQYLYIEKGGENMGEFTKDPGGHRVTDPGVGWHNEPGGDGWRHNQEPGTGWKVIFGPGTGV